MEHIFLPPKGRKRQKLTAFFTSKEFIYSQTSKLLKISISYKITFTSESSCKESLEKIISSTHEEFPFPRAAHPFHTNATLIFFTYNILYVHVCNFLYNTASCIRISTRGASHEVSFRNNKIILPNTPECGILGYRNLQTRETNLDCARNHHF